ncbi:hypothetical protein H1V43_32185 [Streptomyces sp. PSKA54]|uniref:Uncharacterized protein n=1 Tax=Streptomyces himalayensis subsp. aureolus TaxID=2758039 RepID=A0A7W2D6Y4_9ACTN|nr:hypothetical protein [Streptomyces himalayensis]MBA4865924.1 hypothetical protein [Streptomyces himalayensis subsp. aureolus]
MDFQDAINNVIAELTPQPWDYTTHDGTTLRVIPAGLRADPGEAEILIRITRADATGLCEFGITGPDSRGVAEVGVTTADLPKVIEALTEQGWWADNTLVSGALLVAAASGGVVVGVTENHGAGQHVDVGIVLPEVQRLPLASALRRALDVARSWED